MYIHTHTYKNTPLWPPQGEWYHGLLITCGTEEERLGLAKVLEYLVGDGDLSVGVRAEHLFVRGADVVLDVVKE